MNYLRKLIKKGRETFDKTLENLIGDQKSRNSVYNDTLHELRDDPEIPNGQSTEV